jgi:hypothetical protein
MTRQSGDFRNYFFKVAAFSRNARILASRSLGEYAARCFAARSASILAARSFRRVFLRVKANMGVEASSYLIARRIAAKSSGEISTAGTSL